MPGVQALDLPRVGGAFAIWPHQVHLITDPQDPYFDRRVFDPVDRGDLVSVVTHGYQHNIKVVEVAGRNVPVFGKGRTKIGLVINHLSGAHAYKGALRPVLDCIAELKGGVIHDLILERVGKTGVRMTATPMPPKGGAAKAQRLMAVENTHRRAESDAQRAERAQRMTELGVPEVDIMEDLDIKTKATLRRLLKFDPSAPVAPKTRAKSTRPGKKAIDRVLVDLGDPKIGALVSWLRGEATAEDLLAFYPELAEALAMNAKGKKAA